MDPCASGFIGSNAWGNIVASPEREIFLDACQDYKMVLWTYSGTSGDRTVTMSGPGEVVAAGNNDPQTDYEVTFILVDAETRLVEAIVADSDLTGFDEGAFLVYGAYYYDGAGNDPPATNPTDWIGVSTTQLVAENCLRLSSNFRSVTINDGVDAVISITGSPTLDEEDAGVTTFDFTVSRSGDLDEASSVEYTVVGSGSSQATETDFVGGSFASGTINFAPNETTKLLSIQVVGDEEIEADETFTVVLTNPEDALLGIATAVGTIINDDVFVFDPCGSFESTNVPVTIPIQGGGSFTVTSSVPVDLTGTISDVNVYVKGTHTWVSDLRFTLISPEGTEVILISGKCGTNRDFDLTFDDEAVGFIDCPLDQGLIEKPQDPLANFNDENPQGEWILEIRDFTAFSDGGELEEWRIDFCGTFETPNPVAFIEYNSSGTDDFSFVTLSDLPPNSVINFTDNGVQADGRLSSDEGTITWTSPNTVVDCGTIVQIDNSPGASIGSVTGVGSLDFSPDGDQVIAYVGTNIYISALNNEGPGEWQEGAEDEHSSMLPPGLINGISANALDEVDHAKYNENAETNALPVDLVININDKNNWLGDDAVAQSFASTISCEPIPLPVELFDFTATANNREVTLKWSTVSEQNSDYFVVEHSLDGRSFEEIEYVDAMGFSQSLVNYSALHYGSVGDNYYRIRMVDQDGSFDYSEVRVVRIDAGAVTVAMYPTIVHDFANLQVQLEESSDVQVIIFDNLGRPIQQYEMALDQATLNMDLQTLAPGHYVVRCMIGEEQHSIRFVKM